MGKKNKNKKDKVVNKEKSVEKEKPETYTPPKESVDSFELRIEADAYKRMMAYVDCCPDEIQGFGVVSYDTVGRIGIFKVHSVFILPQEVGGADTEIDEDAIGDLIQYVADNDMPLERIRFWWHSHVMMDAFWSGTDSSTINSFSTDWNLSLVTNKKREYQARLDVYKPFRQTYDFKSFGFFFDKDKELEKVVKEEIDEKVERHKIVAAARPLSPYSGYWDDDDNWGWGYREQYSSSSRSNGSRNDSFRRGGTGSVGRGCSRGAQSREPVLRRGGCWQEKSRRAAGSH